ncbi:MAG: hypothetical protein R3F62_08510 [Planctomycetota bacterium]
MVRRAHTIYEVVIAYSLFVGLLAALAPNPRPALDGLRANFEREVARGLCQGELARVEHALRGGQAPASGAVDLAGWPSAAQLDELALRRELTPDGGGAELRVRATWVGRDGSPRELALSTWLRGAR